MAENPTRSENAHSTPSTLASAEVFESRLNLLGDMHDCDKARDMSNRPIARHSKLSASVKPCHLSLHLRALVDIELVASGEANLLRRERGSA